MRDSIEFPKVDLPDGMESFAGVAEHRPLFLRDHPWVAYAAGRIVGYCSSFRLAANMAFDRRGRRGRRTLKVVNAASGEIYDTSDGVEGFGTSRWDEVLH